MINSTIKTDKNYRKKSLQFEVWLVTLQKEVFLKAPKNNNFINITDITITAKNTKSVLRCIEKQWGILCEANQLRKAYAFECIEDEKRIVIQGYTLPIHITQAQKQVVLGKCHGTFIHFAKLEDQIKEYTKDYAFKESFYSLLSNLRND